MCGKQDICLDQNTHAILTSDGEQQLIDIFVLTDLPSPSSQAKPIAVENLIYPCPFRFNRQTREREAQILWLGEVVAQFR